MEMLVGEYTWAKVRGWYDLVLWFAISRNFWWPPSHNIVCRRFCVRPKSPNSVPIKTIRLRICLSLSTLSSLIGISSRRRGVWSILYRLGLYVDMLLSSIFMLQNSIGLNLILCHLKQFSPPSPELNFGICTASAFDLCCPDQHFVTHADLDTCRSCPPRFKFEPGSRVRHCSMLDPSKSNHINLWPGKMVCRDIRDIVEGPPSKLIETVAENIATTVLNNHNMVLGIQVAVRKPNVAIKGNFASLGTNFKVNLKNLENWSFLNFKSHIIDIKRVYRERAYI